MIQFEAFNGLSVLYDFFSMILAKSNQMMKFHQIFRSDGSRRDQVESIGEMKLHVF